MMLKAVNMEYLRHLLCLINELQEPFKTSVMRADYGIRSGHIEVAECVEPNKFVMV
jgi:hypothetical protein